MSIKVYSQIKNEEKIIEIDANNNIFENKDYEILIHLIDKMNNKTCIIKAKKKSWKLKIIMILRNMKLQKFNFLLKKIYNKK